MKDKTLKKAKGLQKDVIQKELDAADYENTIDQKISIFDKCMFLGLGCIPSILN